MDRIKTNRKLNVLVIHNYYQIPGGEDTVVKNEITMLKKKGHNVILYSKNNSDLNDMGFLNKLRLVVDVVFNFSSYREVKEIIMKNDIDIVHVHNTLSLISSSVYYASCAKNVPVIQTIHNFRLMCPNAAFFRNGCVCEDCIKIGLKCSIKHKCYRNNRIQTIACVINLLVHRITGIYKNISYICLTDFNKEKLLMHKQITSNNIYVKPNFVESKTDIIPGEKRQNQIVFAGRLEQIKGIDILFEAWKKMGMNSPKLIVFGRGALEDWCKDFILNNNVNIELKGFVNNSKIIEEVAQSKAVILPTRWYEGFPMSVVEAFSVGTPVICSDIGNCGSVVADSVNGYKFKVDDVIGLITAINNIEGNNDIYKSTYNDYLDKYTEEKNYERLYDIYMTILE